MQAQTHPSDVSRRRPWVAPLLIGIAIVALLGIGGWALLAWLDGGPVPAEDARIDVTFTGTGTSFVGDRVITEGTATMSFTNGLDAPGMLYVMRYETGSPALAEELEFVAEGGSVVTSDAPTPGFVEVLGEWPVPPGTHTYTVDLLAGNTYLFDAGPEDFHQAGLWRMAVIEVVEP